MNLDQLKTELREFIKLSQMLGSTTWTLEEKDWGWELSAEKYFADLHKLTNEPEEVAEARASFIARSRNISPTMAKMMLVAVEHIEAMSMGVNVECSDEMLRAYDQDSKLAQETLQQLLNLWEETK